MNADHGTSGKREPDVGVRYGSLARGSAGPQLVDQMAGAAKVSANASVIATPLNTRRDRLAMTSSWTAMNVTPISWSTSTASSVCHAASDALAMARSGATGMRIAYPSAMKSAKRRRRLNRAREGDRWDAQWRAVATLNAKPESSRNRHDVRPRWNCHTLKTMPDRNAGASSASTVWP